MGIWGHSQDITAEGSFLISDGLLHVLLSMSDSVTFSARPSLVASSFGLGEELFCRGSSTHREVEEADAG